MMTDVWTSAGVIAGIGMAALTGWAWLDPVVALLAAIPIVWSGARLMRRSVLGLMDTALPREEQMAVTQVLDRYRQQAGIDYHALRTRSAASRRFESLHVLVPGAWDVKRGHDLLERIEADLRLNLPRLNVLIHLEPIDDPSSLD
jgi:cation diffusion facilitator family transporter